MEAVAAIFGFIVLAVAVAIMMIAERIMDGPKPEPRRPGLKEAREDMMERNQRAPQVTPQTMQSRGVIGEG